MGCCSAKEHNIKPMFAPPSTNPTVYTRRREIVFIILSGIFLGSLTMLNILGISRFIDLSFRILGHEIPFIFFVGVLPYPITFLATDLISELYGKRRAQYVVWTGLILNIWVLFVLWLAGILPPQPAINPATGLPYDGASDRAFFEIRQLTFGATAASMIAYLTAQFVDVHVFHLLKKLTKEKHLWLRNNGSTLVSQLVDSVSVVLITHYYAQALPVDPNEALWPQMMVVIVSSYVYKFTAALIDTLPFYLSVRYLTSYLNIPSPYRRNPKTKPTAHEKTN